MFNMPKKLVVIFLLYCAIKEVVSYERSFLDVPLEVDKMSELADEIIKLIDEGAKSGDNTTLELQIVANNMHFYFQDPIYHYYKSINELQNQELRNVFNSFMKPAQAEVYKIGRVVNTNSAQIKTTLKRSLHDIIQILPRVKPLLQRLSQHKLKLALNVAKHSYDCALFSYYITYVDTKYRKENNKGIKKEIEATLDRVYKVLKKVDVNVQKTEEFSALCQLPIQYFDRTIFKIQRWIYVYGANDRQAHIVKDVFQVLAKIIGKLRKQTSINATMPDMLKGLKEFLLNVTTEVEKLSEVDEGAVNQPQDIRKDVLLKILANLLTLNTKLQLFITEA